MKKHFYHPVAQLVRVERGKTSGALYIVFEVTDEKFKKKLEKDIMADVDLEMDGKYLVLPDKESE